MPELTAMAKIERAVDFAGMDVPSVAAQLVTVGAPFALSIVVEARGSTSASEPIIAHASIKPLETKTPQIVDVDLDVDRLRARIGSKR
jgi:hypothetical protein